jgi:hypothetical protein
MPIMYLQNPNSSRTWRPGPWKDRLGAIAIMLGILLALPIWGAEHPDLVLIDFQAPAVVTGSLAPTVRVVWGVTNRGPGTAIGAWWDSLRFSTNGLDWQEITGSGEIGPVAAGQSYWRTNTVQVPVYESGTYYLMLTTDAEDSLHESDTNNNDQLCHTRSRPSACGIPGAALHYWGTASIRECGLGRYQPRSRSCSRALGVGRSRPMFYRPFLG